MSKVPGLATDPLAMSMLQEPDLLEMLMDPYHLEKLIDITICIRVAFRPCSSAFCRVFTGFGSNLDKHSATHYGKKCMWQIFVNTICQ